MADDEYALRWFEPGDREAFVSLYDDAFGGGSDEWFDWKYVQNPRVSHVPILVAERVSDGAFAGARPQVPFLFRVGGEDVLGLRFGDTMVHPDHRRRGVFTRLAERALDHYASMPTRFCFNCPNDKSRPGFLKAGGEVIAHLPSFYRVQNPARVAGATRDGVTGAVLGRLAAPAADGYLGARDRLAGRQADVAVTRHHEVPVGALADAYERGAPDGVHAVRDEAFLDWRYDNPNWTYEAYTASAGGDRIAAVVTGRQTDADGVTTTNVVDALPLTGDDRRAAGLEALLGAVTDDHADADLLGYCGTAIPRRVLRAHGFHFDGVPPLSWVTSPTKLVAYDLAGDGDTAWQATGLDLRDGRNWALSYAELDAR
ncbi:GNAT family N-acetyltransferase [Halobacterium litoreum]|uniref:GNAT family N-acetyltransferase n=1 Tax=Halobacterium litoreum TaxID=2039234 RepID=A0ABD5NAV9_9EURY|nr:GNAT family N-acetyltransferase [Halobacterium litoreum]UHH14650.1 GNAT family N-acetyltransferase [Halobacterium litoreum]